MSYGEVEGELFEFYVRGFEFEREIGKGFYGKVYKVVWNGSEVVVKRFYCVFFENGFS